MKGKYENKNNRGIHILTVSLTVIALVLSPVLVSWGLQNLGVPGSSVDSQPSDLSIMDIYDMQMTNKISDALEGVLAIDKVYWLNDKDLIAPEPNPSCYGKSTDPASLQWLLDKAADMLDIEKFVFNTNISIRSGTEINYYLDETIFAIVWQEVRQGCTYTFSEVKIAHASQFRRFLAGGTYGSDKQFFTTQMASDVNAVVASSGDFYKFRNYGIIVHEGIVRRVNGEKVDTCFIDDKGELIFVRAGQITTMEAAQKFVDENNIRFSIAFGPILIENGQRCEPYSYPIGEINERYARAGLAKVEDLHYLIATANRYETTPTIHDFAQVMLELGVEKAYTLDGGQTGVIAMNDQMMNPNQYGSQRAISDIFYFATAIPDGG